VELNKIMLFIGLSYLFLIWRSGTASYSQFKWASSLIPLFVVSFFGVIALSIPNKKPAIAKTLCAAMGVLIALHVVLIQTWVVRDESRQASVTAHVRDLDRLTQDDRYPQLNIKTGAYKESMWPAFFLKDTRTAILDPSYYSVTEPLESPTLVKRDFKSYYWIERVEFNEMFDLVKFPEQPVRQTGETVNFRVGVSEVLIERAAEPSLISVDVTNIGVTTWLGSGPCSNCVQMLFKIERISDGATIQNWQLATLEDFPNYVPPEKSIKLDLPIPGIDLGEYRVTMYATHTTSGLHQPASQQSPVTFLLRVLP
jgi:hypothetical protein